MGRFWSLLFLLVPILGVGVFVLAAADLPPFRNHWLPANINAHGRIIDNLFLFILYLTGAIFIGCGIAMFWFLWKYDSSAVRTEPVVYTHGSHTLEVVWSILPAATLLFIAIYQMNAWADAKMRRPTELLDNKIQPQRPLALVTGRQFEWRIRYAYKDGVIGVGPGADGKLGTADDFCDDVFVVNTLHLPVDEEIVLQIESDDVLHSFFLPNMRIKQDVVPGMTQFVWFQPNREGPYDIVCAELCGWGHYKMRGRLFIESRRQFETWLDEQYAEQNRSSFTGAQEEAEDEGE